ncbi:TraR/DksA family transcriptional regulator [Humibacillus xanthopallidus]|uniref:TraR/DksA family transcriptional regulator n=1 Tax=Humibacillus xanthopallidus TaxID=412689 RepID=A0A543PLQ2_9MICO|nr:TraR/DksA C4-type zinc finger protein [Humibacillus xanthopallidus]TQN45006.1 TraR/DksA family transcriptional regulator [Humibacillus xanthopallidus]
MSEMTTAQGESLAHDHATEVERLAALRREFAEVVDATEMTNADDEHDPEGSTIAYERTQIAAFITQAEHHLEEIEAAQQRLADGTYGLCEVCGGRIPDARLEARPTATTCVEHTPSARTAPLL